MSFGLPADFDSASSFFSISDKIGISIRNIGCVLKESVMTIVNLAYTVFLGMACLATACQIRYLNRSFLASGLEFVKGIQLVPLHAIGIFFPIYAEENIIKVNFRNMQNQFSLFQ